ncbi:MAG: permease [Armatimonadota bacterium]
MAVSEQAACTCESLTEETATPEKTLRIRVLILALSVSVWVLLYQNIQAFAQWLTYEIIGLQQGTHLGEAIEFFVYDTPKVLLLLSLVVFGVGVMRSFVTPERTRDLLSGRRELGGNVLASLMGVITPFCSCSAVPLFIGFVEAGIPLGVTFSFLITAPMVNEVAVVLLAELVGWKIAALYLGTGIVIAVTAGWIIGRLNLEHLVEDWVYEMRAGETASTETAMTWSQRLDYGLEALGDIVGRVWIWVVIGIAVGAGIHGYVPESFLDTIMGKSNWWSVPAAVIMGVPMYTNHLGIIPVVEALLGKGAAVGTVLSFMMSVIALSLPEMIILRKVLKPKLIAGFVAIVAVGIIGVGFLFNFLL